MVTLQEAATELYRAQPGDFVNRREALTKQARSEGDRTLAQRIKAMRRPTVAAWVLNTLVQEESPTLSDLLTVGAQLRAAQAMLDRDAMKELTARRQAGERAVVEEAVARFAERGEKLTPVTVTEVENTLRAAVADPAAAAAVGSGQLVRALSYAGFGEVDLTSATAVPAEERDDAASPATAPAGTTPPDRATSAKSPAEPGTTRAADSNEPQTARVVTFPRRSPADATSGGETVKPVTGPADAADPEADEAASSSIDTVEDDAELLAAQQALQEAQERLARASARRELTTARRDIEAALHRHAQAETERQAAQTTITDLEDQLAQARERLATATHDADAAAADLDTARKRLAAAQNTKG